MNIGIVGLGLIGGSIARAFKHFTTETVMGWNRSQDALYKARLLEAIDCELNDERLGICDYVIVALYPRATIDYVKEKCDLFKPGAIVMDICGVKRVVCDELFSLAKEKGFTFIGGHPMAGLERSGFENSTPNMFRNASMIITPPDDISIEMLAKIKKFWGQIGFSNMEVTTPENHDRVIAYTSQLAHIASSAYIKSPTALDHKGFSAGSYKDLTRVARLSEGMWAELFMENQDNLLRETDTLIAFLQEYREALAAGDEEKMRELLKAGRIQKETADAQDMR